jgi:hypothetical protein
MEGVDFYENAPVYNVIQLNLKKVQVNLQKEYLQVTIILDSGVELIFRIECAIDALSLSVSMIFITERESLV